MKVQTIYSKVLARIYGYGRGKVFSPMDFLDLGPHEAVRQTLARLEKEGTLRRVMRGLYEYPVKSPIFEGSASPDPDAIAQALARVHGWTITPEGNTALNLLGLSTQVPAKWEYVTDGPSKTYTWKDGSITFKHRANKETTIVSPRTALVVQALKALGEKNVNETTLETLRKKLNKKDLKRALREARYATTWVYEVLKRLEG